MLDEKIAKWCNLGAIVESKHVKHFLPFLVGACSCVAIFSPALPAIASVNVTQHHNNLSRDGLYITPAFTQSAAASLTRDTGFDGTISGQVYAQPLYVEGGPSGPVVIAVTESNNVYALNATTGAIVWQRNVGTPSGSMGNISPNVGITGTPVVDLATRSLFLDAVVSGPNNLIFSLNVDTGAIKAGWPVDVNAAISGFNSTRQSERAALTVVNSVVYVPYGGYFGDAAPYFGRVVGVAVSNPASIGSYATTAPKSGIWGPGGIASDGTNLFVTTGNATGGTSTWGGQEAILRLQAGPVFSGATTDYWAPTNWMSLDSGDTDLGGSGPILVDVPGATPSALAVALGKNGNAYLVDRSNLGGITTPVASANVNSGTIIQAAATYRTTLGTYVVFRGSSSTTKTFRINATNPPTITTTTWSVTGASGRSSPFVTSTDGTNDVVVWVVGSGGDNRLHGYDADTGAVIFGGGGANELMAGTRGYNANGIAARNHIFVAADNKVYSFSVPVAALSVSSAVSRKTHGAAGTFDIPLPLSGTPGVECRSGGATNDYTFIFSFSNNVESGNASVDSGIGNLAGTPLFSGNTMTVNLTGVANVQALTVSLNGVTDEFAQTLPTTSVTVKMLIGDTTGNGSVNATDVSDTKAQSGQSVSSSNFRTDVTADGNVNATDVSLVKMHSGEAANPPARESRAGAKK